MSWELFLREESEKPYYRELISAIENDKKKYRIIPECKYNALSKTPFNKVKVVIIGQDPYPNHEDAMGLSFSVNRNRKIPRSLKNIYKEIETDLRIDMSGRDGDLSDWAYQGVLLLNRTLTVREGHSNSHYNFPNKDVNWCNFTSNIIKALNRDSSPKVFILWGKNAQELVPIIANKNHLVLTGAHPSPLSARNGFFGGRYFSRTNEFLISNKITPIKW